LLQQRSVKHVQHDVASTIENLNFWIHAGDLHL
jgi:hypothetical protein